MINAFKYTKQLEEAGFTRQQAELQLQVISEIVEDDLATKQDLTNLKTELKADMEAMSSRLEIKINNLDNKIQQVEYRITIRLGSMMIVGFTTMATLMKIWIGH